MADKLILEFQAKTDDLDKRLKAVEGSVGNVGKTSKKVASDMEAQFKKVGGQIATAFGVTMGIAAFASVMRGAFNAAKDFEQQMSKVRAISGATNSEMERLGESAKALGASTMFTATQVGELQEAYARLGFTTKEILAATAATLDLAAATGSTLAEAADVAGSTVRGFGLDASETVRVTDVMALSFSKTGLGMSSFAEAMKMVAPVAKIAGISIETTTAMLGKLADANLRGSLAGTALRNLLGHLSDANSALSKQLGFSVKNADDLFRAFKLLQKGNIDLTAATELTDKRSLAAFITLIDGIDTVEELNGALDNATGSTKRMAEIMQDNLAGSITKLSSAWEGFTNQMLGSQGALKAVVDLLTQTIQGWGFILQHVSGTTIEQMQAMSLTLEMVEAAVKGATKSIEKYIKPLADAGDVAGANAKANEELERSYRLLNSAQDEKKKIIENLAKAEKGLVAIQKSGASPRDIAEIVKAKKAEIEQMKLKGIAVQGEIDEFEAVIGVYERYIEQLNKAGGEGGEGGAIASNTRSIASLTNELKEIEAALKNAEVGGSDFYRILEQAKQKTDELNRALAMTRLLENLTPDEEGEDEALLNKIKRENDLEHKQYEDRKKAKEEFDEWLAKKTEEELEALHQTNLAKSQSDKERFEAAVKEFSTYARAAQSLIQTIADAQAAASQYELGILQDSLNQGLISREEYDMERRKIMRKEAMDAKALGLLNAIIGTAAGIAEALPNVPLSILAGVLGAIQIGVIASQPIPQFAEGGYVDAKGRLHGRTHGQGGIHIEAEGGEFITKASQAKKYGHIVEAVNKGTIEKLIAETYVRPAVDAAILNGWGDLQRSVEVNAAFNDMNLLRAIDRHRASDKEGFKYLAAELSRNLRQPKRGYA
jgi:TP901 family phage tail tape measure protein